MSKSRGSAGRDECSTALEEDRSETGQSTSNGGGVDTSRRAVLAGVAGMLTAAVAELAPRKAQAQKPQSQPLLLESTNFTTNVTELDHQPVPRFEDAALRVSTITNPGVGIMAGSEWGAGMVGASGPAAVTGTASTTMALSMVPVGVAGLADFGTGVRGASGPLAIGVTVSSSVETGVLGASEKGAGVIGVSGPQAVGSTVTTSGPWISAGIVGQSDLGFGLIGLSGPQAFGATASTTLPSSAGVVGRSEVGAGVHGVTLDPSGVGVVAENAGGGIALDVHGRVRLSTSGCGELPVKTRTHQVDDPSVVAESVVFVTFLAAPRPKGLRVTHVEVLPGIGFVIHLKGKPRKPVPFAYLVIDRADAC